MNEIVKLGNAMSHNAAGFHVLRSRFVVPHMSPCTKSRNRRMLLVSYVWMRRKKKFNRKAQKSVSHVRTYYVLRHADDVRMPVNVWVCEQDRHTAKSDQNILINNENQWSVLCFSCSVVFFVRRVCDKLTIATMTTTMATPNGINAETTVAAMAHGPTIATIMCIYMN